MLNPPSVRRVDAFPRLIEWGLSVCIALMVLVFASREARELARVLAALAQPANERLLRAALATDLMGVDGSRL